MAKLTDEQKQRISDLSRALVGMEYVLGAEVPLGKVNPAMEIPAVVDLVDKTKLDCSEMVQVVFKWATGVEVVDLAANQYRESEGLGFLGLDHPEIGDLGFKRLEGKIAHVGIYIGDGHVAEARGKSYGVILRDAKTGWQAQSVFAGWRRLKIFIA